MEWKLDEPIPAKLGSKIPDYNKPKWTPKQMERLDDCSTALDWYEVFSTPEWLDTMFNQSQIYAVSMGRVRDLQHITKDNIR